MKRKETVTVALYNVENLFDTIDDPFTLDDDYTSEGKLRWNSFKYNTKIKKISSVISQIGTNLSSCPPAIVGLVEIENKDVIEGLIKHQNLHAFHYDYVHHESPDERGIDVALIYQRTLFELISSTVYPLDLYKENGEVDYTRDILMVKGKLNNELVYIFVNHWPSRRSGEEISEPHRIKAANVVCEAMEVIKHEDPDAKFIIMGDFNDDPTSTSIKDHLVKDELFNPMERLFNEGIGSSTYNKKWHLFDQIIFSKNFFNSTTKHSFSRAGVFSKDWLRVHSGKLKGSPFRTYIGPWYKGGFSDHFPVYVSLRKEM